MPGMGDTTATQELNARWRRLASAAAAAGWLAVAACGGVVLLFDARLADVGRSDLGSGATDAVYVLPLASAATVGAALAFLRPRHPVGWLFLALGLAIAASAVADAYAAYGAIARPGSLPGAGFVAVIGDKSFIAWLLLLTLILLLTPTGSYGSPRWRLAAYVAIAGSAIGFGLGLIGPYEGEHASLRIVKNPAEVEVLQRTIHLIRLFGILALHAVLLAAVGSIVARFRAASGAERKQLRWLALAAIPFPMFVVGAFVAAVLRQELLLAWLAAGFIAVIPVAAGLAIAQHGLYNVDHLLTRGLTYGLLSALVVACYAIVVVFVGQALGGVVGSSQVAAVIATLAAVSVALPARRYIQDGLDRRFNRRQFEAINTIRRWLRDPAPVTSLQRALRESTGDDALRVAYWIDERERWVDEAGVPAVLDPDGITVKRRGVAIAAVTFDAHRIERATVEAVLGEAVSELENVRLRAALALQLVEVRESRSRIVSAQVAERRKIERNLHDGAQQRLLGLAMQLSAAEISRDPTRALPALHSAVGELQLAVKELRDLANGLVPATLTDEGLGAALEDLAARTPVPVRLSTTGERFPAPIEETAWFIACEAVANAVKHAGPRSVDIAAGRDNGFLRLVVEDDGIGGADPSGAGLRGIADRAETIGGHLTVHERPGAGTIVIAELPCGS
jgi:signal transduction histidine kinase